MSSSYIDQAIITYLLGKTAYTTYVGDRLYHIRAPQGAPLPYSTLRLVSPDNTPVILATEKAGHHLFQLETTSLADRTGSLAFLVSQEVITLMRHYKGSMDGVTVRYVSNLAGPYEFPDPEFRDRVRCVVSWEIEYEEVA